jgi:hypothetical protein
MQLPKNESYTRCPIATDMAIEVVGWTVTTHRLPTEATTDFLEIVREVIIEVAKRWLTTWGWWRYILMVLNFFNIRGYAVEQELENKVNFMPHYRKQFANRINKEFSYLSRTELDLLIKEAASVDKL